MKIKFRQIEAQTSFEGGKQIFDAAETVGNEMMYNGRFFWILDLKSLQRKSIIQKMK